jgi:TolB-like protein/Tfp pilus assembly protein PilF
VVGETLSRYRIVELLGSGAMGDVYRADDLRLKRPVALKVVRTAGDAPRTSQRLLQEARAASALSHPNIAVVYEVDEVDHDGTRIGFITMEYVDGRTLADIASSRPLPLETILDIGGQVAGALAHAHDHGIVHRDIKPANLMVTASGLVKVLDFGVARPADPFVDFEASTRTGEALGLTTSAVGTLPYMSPEQAAGRALDGRSDMFSLGVVLYELIAGRRPFEGATAVQLLEALLRRDPPSIDAALDDSRVVAVERVLRRMLEKQPDDRYEDLLTVGLALAAARRGDPAATDAPAGPPLVAVTAFRNITADAEDDWLGTGIAETLMADLGGVAGVAVLPGTRVHALVRSLARRTGETGDGLGLRAGRELNARWVLTGSFQRAAEAIRVTASVLEVATGQAVRTVKVDGRLDRIFELQDRLVRDLTEGLRAATSAGASSPETGIVGAYEAFSRGVLNLRSESYESLERAIVMFERAVALDPGYARAHLELGAAYATKADYLAVDELRGRAVAALRRALELQPVSVRALRELGAVLVSMGQEAEGFDALHRGLEIDPVDAGALGAMARALFIGRAQFADAAAWYERALAQNPNGGWYALQLAHCCALMRDFGRGEEAARRAIALQEAVLSGQEGVHIIGGAMRLGHLVALQGRHRDAIDQFTRELDLLSQVDHALRSRIVVELNVRLGASYLAVGDTQRARTVLETAAEAFDRRVRLGADEPFTRYYAAAAHALRGDADTAVTFLARAAAQRRALTLARARIEPEFEALRGDARLQRLLLSA